MMNGSTFNWDNVPVYLTSAGISGGCTVNWPLN